MRIGRAPQGVAATAFASEPRPDASVDWRAARWCAVDLEMTGLDPRSDEIVAIGAVPIDGGRIQLGGGMYTLVRASKRSQVGAVLVHKLRLADVVDAPSLDDAIDRLLGALAGRVPVFHTAAIEAAFLGREFTRPGQHEGLQRAGHAAVAVSPWMYADQVEVGHRGSGVGRSVHIPIS